jgi:hypothetical protein
MEGRQLLPQRQVFQDQFPMAAERQRECADSHDDQLQHAVDPGRSRREIQLGRVLAMVSTLRDVDPGDLIERRGLRAPEIAAVPPPPSVARAALRTGADGGAATSHLVQTALRIRISSDMDVPDACRTYTPAGRRRARFGARRLAVSMPQICRHSVTLISSLTSSRHRCFPVQPSR